MRVRAALTQGLEVGSALSTSLVAGGAQQLVAIPNCPDDTNACPSFRSTTLLWYRLLEDTVAWFMPFAVTSAESEARQAVFAGVC